MLETISLVVVPLLLLCALAAAAWMDARNHRRPEWVIDYNPVTDSYCAKKRVGATSRYAAEFTDVDLGVVRSYIDDEVAKAEHIAGWEAPRRRRFAYPSMEEIK